MPLIISHLSKIKDILNLDQKKELNYFFILFFIAMLFEMLGIGLIIPLLNTLVNQDTNFFLINFFEKNNFFQLSNFLKSNAIIFFVVLILLVYILKTILLIYVYKKETNFLKRIRVNLSTRIFQIYLNLPYSFHVHNNSGNLIRNINDIKIFINFIIHTLSIVIETLIFVGLLIILMLYEPLVTTVVILITFTLGFILNNTIKKKSYTWGKVRQKFEGLKIINTQQTLNSIKEVKVFFKEFFFIKLFEKIEIKAAESVQKHDFLIRLPKVILEASLVIILSSLIIILVNLKFDFKEIIPTLALFTLVSFRVFPSIAKIIRSYQIIKFGTPVLDNLKNQIQLSKKSITFSKNDKKISFSKNIRFKNIDFSYENYSKKIFLNFNFLINKGDLIGIYGDSGNGKTTFLNILLGLSKPEKGQVLIDGKQDVQDNIKSWNRNVGFVPQNICLLEGSLKSNIAFGLKNKEIDNNLVNKLVKIVKLEKFVKKLKNGINTTISENGNNISGGQKQRIGIARALYHDPQLIILDEATNAIDKETSKEIINHIMQKKNNKTIVIISHDYFVLKNCDKVFNLRNRKLILDKS